MCADKKGYRFRSICLGLPIAFLLKVGVKKGGQMQLLMEIDVETPDVHLIPLRILVDTGAQVNSV